MTDNPLEKLPQASFSTLVTMLATQAMAALGQIPGLGSEQPVVNAPLAKHFIDTLAVLEAKTKGNLSELEAQMLESMLYELRLLFVAAEKKK
jgi:hypothetical protein